MISDGVYHRDVYDTDLLRGWVYTRSCVVKSAALTLLGYVSARIAESDR